MRLAALLGSDPTNGLTNLRSFYVFDLLFPFAYASLLSLTLAQHLQLFVKTKCKVSSIPSPLAL